MNFYKDQGNNGLLRVRWKSLYDIWFMCKIGLSNLKFYKGTNFFFSQVVELMNN